MTGYPSIGYEIPNFFTFYLPGGGGGGYSDNFMHTYDRAFFGGFKIWISIFFGVFQKKW